MSEGKFYFYETSIKFKSQEPICLLIFFYKIWLLCDEDKLEKDRPVDNS